MNEFVEQLGWVLVHSLWQFAAVALLAAGIARVMLHSSASLRYVALVAALAAATSAPVATWLLLQPLATSPNLDLNATTFPGTTTSAPTDAQAVATMSNSLRGDIDGLSEEPSVDIASGIADVTSSFPSAAPQDANAGLTWSQELAKLLRPWLTWIVAAWSAGVVVCSVRPLWGWHTLWRLKRVGVSPVPDEVLKAAEEVASRLGLRRVVRVLQSTLAQVPVVVGYFKPVILLPASLLIEIPAVQLEAILAHELAHVRRHDFVVNLLQILVETLFFYHPAVWWLSRQIRIEREHCCDDLVVKSFDNRVEYGRALLAIEERRGRTSVLALGANDGSLLSRIRRIVRTSPDRSATRLRNRWPATFLSLMLLSAACVLLSTWGLAAKDNANLDSSRFESDIAQTQLEESAEDLEVDDPLVDGQREEVATVNDADKKAQEAGTQETSVTKPKPSLPPLEFRVAAQPADSDAEPRVPKDLTQRHYPDNTPEGRTAAKDRGFIWVPIAKPKDGGVILPIEGTRGESRSALLGDTTDTAFVLEGQDRIIKCNAEADQNSLWSIRVKLDEAAGATFRRLTKAHMDRQLAIIVDGSIIAAPVVRSEIGSEIMISGNFTREEAEKLVAVLSAREEPDEPVAAKLVQPAYLLPDRLNVMAVGFDRDAKNLTTVSTENDVSIRTWDLVDKKLKSEVKLVSEKHGNMFLSGHLTLSADRQRVLVVLDGKIGIWDAATGKLVKWLELPEELQHGFIRGLTCTPDMSRVACGRTPGFGGFATPDAHAIVWDVTSGKVIQTMKHVDAVQVQSIALSADGEWLATGGQQAGTCIWEVKTGTLARALPNENPGRKHPDPMVTEPGTNQVLCLKFSPDGRQLALGDMLGVKVVDVKSGERIYQFDAPFRYGRSGLVFSKDGRLLARVATDKVVPIWSMKTGKLVTELPTEAHDGSFSEDGRWFAVSFTDSKNGVAVWQLRSAPRATASATASATTGEEDILARKVSLTASAMPLKDALKLVAQAAQLELRLDAQALNEVDLDVDSPVTVTIKDAPLSEALNRLIPWHRHQGAFRKVQSGKLIITTLQADQQEIARRLPEWLQPVYQRGGLLAQLDGNDQVISITAGNVVNDELLAKIKTLPGLRELSIETTKELTPAGLVHLSELASLRKLSLYSLAHDGTGLGDAAIKQIIGLKSLRELSVGECGTTDAGAQLLESLPQLTHLSLSQEGRLTNAALVSIGKLKQLKSLSLNSYVATQQYGQMRFTFTGLKSLAGLQELEHLHLVGHAALADALVFPKLKTLSLGGTEVDDACAARIAACRDLQELSLVFTGITNVGLRQIAELPDLVRLNLDSAVVTDSGVQHLKKLAKLQHASLRVAALTDESLKHLAEIKSLNRVDLYGGNAVTISGVQQLKALPDLRTLWLTNFQSPGGFMGLKDLGQLHELSLLMTNLRDDEFDQLEDALPNTVIHHATGGGSVRVPRKQGNQGQATRAQASAPQASATVLQPAANATLNTRAVEITLLGGSKKEPLADLDVEIISGRGQTPDRFGKFKTDAAGRINVALAPKFYTLRLSSRKELAYLPIDTQVRNPLPKPIPTLDLQITETKVAKWVNGEAVDSELDQTASGDRKHRVTYTLISGCELVLRAIDADTGKGLPGAIFYMENALGEYWAHDISGDNLGAKRTVMEETKDAKPDTTDADGYFRRLVSTNEGYKYGVWKAPPGYEQVKPGVEVEIATPLGKPRAEYVFQFRQKAAAVQAEKPSADVATFSGRFVFDGQPPAEVDYYSDLSKLQVDAPIPQGLDGRVAGVSATYHSYLQQKIRPRTADQTLVVGKDGGLANIVVWVESKNIPWSARKAEDLKPAVLKLKDGNFLPRVTTLMVGQNLLIENHDPIQLNLAADMMRNSSINMVLPVRNVDTPVRLSFPVPERLPVRYQSPFAAWANGVLVIRQNPYVAVTGEDGAFAFPELPPGEWEFRAWHERAGYVSHWPKGLFKLQIKPGENSLGTIRIKPEVFGQESQAVAATPPAKREQIGELFGKPVYRDELKDGDVHTAFFWPVSNKYREDNRVAIEPTADEVRFAADYFDRKHKERLAADGQEAQLRSRLKEVESRLLQPDLPDADEQKLVSEKSSLNARLNPPGAGFAHFMLDNWKLQKHLYDKFGGGRVLWQQAGMEAFDAMRTCLETMEKEGQFKITDPKLRAQFYEYWTRSHGSFLIADKERIRKEFLEPEWVQRTTPAKPAEN